MSPSKIPDSTKKNNGFLTLILWFTLAILLRWQVVEPRWIPSGSMLPTLEVQDKILVEKISPKINRILNHNESRESIVVFKPPKALIDAGFDAKSALIKRIIGIPGDQIQVKEGSLIINGIEKKEKWLKSPIKYSIQQFEVPEHTYWVLGDNRNNLSLIHI